MDDDWRFNIAYNAALQASTAALVAAGYTIPKGESHHFRVIQSLAFTLGLDSKSIDKLDRHRKKRSISVYEVAGAISDEEAKSMQDLAAEIIEVVHAWLVENYPDLLSAKK